MNIHTSVHWKRKVLLCSLHMFCIIVFDIGCLVLHIVCDIKFSDVKCQSLIDNNSDWVKMIRSVTCFATLDLL